MNRYQKQILLPEVGPEGQAKLAKAKVLVVGAGGLGCPVLLYLTAAGVGTIGIVDHDLVSVSNLHRQVLYTEADVDKPKVACAKRYLSAQNSEISILCFQEKLSLDNAQDIISGFDLVVDCTDNFAVRYAINDACVLQNKPFVYGAIHRFEGQVSLFNYTSSQGVTGPSYRCVFPEKPVGALIPNCDELGVLGVLPGIIGCYQAMEALKVVLGLEPTLSGVLLLVDVLGASQQKIKIQRTPEAKAMAIKGLEAKTMKQINASQLHTWFLEEKSFAIIDVREDFEYEVCHLPNSKLIPLSTLSADKLPTDKQALVFLCHHGIRSQHAIQYLTQQSVVGDFYNLEGGIDAWSVAVDITLPRY
jgi:sulfur-carrier protein adenylyltransferase/sulfurtransferase